jgi:hypothetical protein
LCATRKRNNKKMKNQRKLPRSVELGLKSSITGGGKLSREGANEQENIKTTP